MAARTDNTLWEARPHTIAKVAILRQYLYAWFAIMGRHPGRHDLLYIDGFAGPGEYTNSPHGSPLVALTSAQAALTGAGPAWRAGKVHCAFIEADPKRLAHLTSRLDGFRSFPIAIHEIGAEFVDGLAELQRRLSFAFRDNSALFVFIDPFGAKGVPFSAVAGILRSQRSEVLINLDADGIARIFRASSNANREAILDAVFGAHSWRERISINVDFGTQCRQVLELYIERLELPHFGGRVMTTRRRVPARSGVRTRLG